MGKGGGGKQRTPVEHNDTLTSSQMVSLIDIWGEGQIVGLADGLKSVYLDDTQVMSDSGKINISGVQIESNLGTRDQTYLSGFPQNASEIGVNVQIKNSSPAIRTVTDNRIDMLRINMYSNGLYAVNKQGDTLEYNLVMEVQLKGPKDSDFVTAKRVSFIGQKSRAEFYFQAEVWELPETPFDVRVVRVTNDDTSNETYTQIVNNSFWRSYSVVINQKYRWPYTAYCGLKFDSKNFGGQIPKRSYFVKGLIIKVPSNYDPVRRTYGGFWDGSFKSAYSNNPAWIAYDLIKNKRYGLGGKNIDINEGALYLAAQWCDQLVDNGQGVLEPRCVCNAFISSQRKAWDLLNDIFSIFRAIPVFDGKSLSVSVDYTKDPVASYNNSNVVDGEFIYGASAGEDRHSVVEVTYIDKTNNYEQAIEYVQSDEAIRLYGYNVKKVEAFGTDTRSQARRVGLYILETERLERKTVGFKTGAAGLKHLPGDIIKVADSDYYGGQIGGRVISVDASRKVITLDRPVEVPNNASTQNFLTLVDDKGMPQEYRITALSADKLTVTLSTTAPARTGAMDAWALTVNNLGTKLYRCISIGNNDDGSFSVNCVEHYPQKQSIVDNGVVFEPPVDSLYGNKIPAPEDLAIEATPDSPKGQARAYWNAPQTARNIRYNIVIKVNGAIVVNAVTWETQFYMSLSKTGTYNVQVRGISDKGEAGETAEAVFTMGPPPQPLGINWTTGNLTATLRPVLSPLRTLGEQYEWFFGASQAEVLAMTNNLGFAFVMNKVDLRVNTYYWFGVRAVNNLGKSPVTAVQVLTKFDSADLDALINLALPKTSYIAEINKDIAGLSDLASLRAVDKNGGRPRITGVYVNAGNAENNLASVVDFAADAVAISSPDNLERWVAFDSSNRKLVIIGDIRARGGVLDNVTINENCVIKGTLSANRIDGDVCSVSNIAPIVLQKNNGANNFRVNFLGGQTFPVRFMLFGAVWNNSGSGSVTSVRVSVNGADEIKYGVNGSGSWTVEVPAGQSAYINIRADSIDDGQAISFQPMLAIVIPVKNRRFSGGRGDGLFPVS